MFLLLFSADANERANELLKALWGDMTPVEAWVSRLTPEQKTIFDQTEIGEGYKAKEEERETERQKREAEYEAKMQKHEAEIQKWKEKKQKQDAELEEREALFEEIKTEYTNLCAKHEGLVEKSKEITVPLGEQMTMVRREIFDVGYISPKKKEILKDKFDTLKKLYEEIIIAPIPIQTFHIDMETWIEIKPKYTLSLEEMQKLKERLHNTDAQFKELEELCNEAEALLYKDEEAKKLYEEIKNQYNQQKPEYMKLIQQFNDRTRDILYSLDLPQEVAAKRTALNKIHIEISKIEASFSEFEEQMDIVDQYGDTLDVQELKKKFDNLEDNYKLLKTLCDKAEEILKEG